MALLGNARLRFAYTARPVLGSFLMIAKMTEALRDRRLIFIIRVGVSEHVVDMVETIWRAGGSFVEVTLNTPDALNAISSLRTRPPDGWYLGAGTVMGPRDAESAHEAGASFVVTPVASLALVSRIGELG